MANVFVVEYFACHEPERIHQVAIAATSEDAKRQVEFAVGELRKHWQHSQVSVHGDGVMKPIEVGMLCNDNVGNTIMYSLTVREQDLRQNKVEKRVLKRFLEEHGEDTSKIESEPELIERVVKRRRLVVVRSC